MVADATILVEIATIACRDDSARGGAHNCVSLFVGSSNVESVDWPKKKIDSMAKARKAGF
jgi:hypothetical protein